MINNKVELKSEINMLAGNINRICVSNDIEELEKMYFTAVHRINEIYEYNVKRIKSKSK